LAEHEFVRHAQAGFYYSVGYDTYDGATLVHQTLSLIIAAVAY